MKTSDQILKTCCNSSCSMGPLIEQVKEMETFIDMCFKSAPSADGTSELSYEAKLMNLANTARDNGQVRLSARLCDISIGVGAIGKAQSNIDKIIFDLFTARWSGDSTIASIQAMSDQLHKSLTDQTNGYWSGHTAYGIMIDGGFLIDAKHGNRKPKKLTSLGKMFMEGYKPL